MNLSRTLPAFSVGFMIIYLCSLVLHPDLTLFTYSPRTGQWYSGVPDLGKSGPGMYWYSWLATAFIGGTAMAAIAASTPPTIRAKIRSDVVWVTPVALTLILIYIERTWFGIK